MEFKDEELRVYSAYKTLLEMLEDRGYYVSKELKELSKEELIPKYQLEEGITVVCPKRFSNDKILVSFITEKKAVTQKSLESIATKMAETKTFDGIIISNVGLNSAAEKVGTIGLTVVHPGCGQ